MWLSFSACNPGPCQNGGTCRENAEGKFMGCDCPPHYSPPLCKKPQGMVVFQELKTVLSPSPTFKVYWRYSLPWKLPFVEVILLYVFTNIIELQKIEWTHSRILTSSWQWIFSLENIVYTFNEFQSKSVLLLSFDVLLFGSIVCNRFSINYFFFCQYWMGRANRTRVYKVECAFPTVVHTIASVPCVSLDLIVMVRVSWSCHDPTIRGEFKSTAILTEKSVF